MPVVCTSEDELDGKMILVSVVVVVLVEVEALVVGCVVFLLSFRSNLKDSHKCTRS
jgi:hypothetical protein